MILTFICKLIAGELIPTDGMIKRHSHLKIARYHQHLAEKLDMNLSPLQYMMKEYPEIKEIEDMRKIVGRYGITGKNQVVPISSLSDGLRVSIIFSVKAEIQKQFIVSRCPCLVSTSKWSHVVT